MNNLIKTVTASAVALSVTAAAPLKAEANPLIIAPAVAAVVLGGAIVGGVLVGSAAANSAPAAVVAPAPTGSVYVQDTPTDVGQSCYFTHARINGVWHRVRRCS